MQGPQSWRQMDWGKHTIPGFQQLLVLWLPQKSGLTRRQGLTTSGGHLQKWPEGPVPMGILGILGIRHLESIDCLRCMDATVSA